MQNQNDYSKNSSFQQAMQLAQTPEGQQLLSLLQKNGGDSVRIAMEKAAAGDMEQAKKAASSLLADPRVRELLKKLGR